MDQLSILLIEDDKDVCNRFLEYTDNFEELKIVKITDNSNQALQDVVTYMPCVIILDLELHEGGGNGLDFLAQLRNVCLSHRPYILITTNNSSKITFQLARELGADFIMSKHQENYSEESVIDLLRTLREPLLKYINISYDATPSTHTSQKRIINKIHTELNSIGISPKAIGYQYLTDGILLILNNQRSSIIDTIAEKYHKTPGSVERAMQNIINRTWMTSDIETLARYYTATINSVKGSPTTTEFIYYYARKISDEML
ncbi:MAG: sporulation initiation factor Spo0A C-terminal domain-containing protein [Butyrivibrio sp.]